MNGSPKYAEQKRRELILEYHSVIEDEREFLNDFRERFKKETDYKNLKLIKEIIENTEIKIAKLTSKIKGLISEEVDGEQLIKILKQS